MRSYQLKAVAYNSEGHILILSGPHRRLGEDMTGREMTITFDLPAEKTPGQVAHESIGHVRWETLSETSRAEYETLAQAVLDWDAERRRKVVKDI